MAVGLHKAYDINRNVRRNIEIFFTNCINGLYNTNHMGIFQFKWNKSITAREIPNGLWSTSKGTVWLYKPLSLISKSVVILSSYIFTYCMCTFVYLPVVSIINWNILTIVCNTIGSEYCEY